MTYIGDVEDCLAGAGRYALPGIYCPCMARGLSRARMARGPGMVRVIAPGAMHLVFFDSAPPLRPVNGLAPWLGFGSNYTDSDASAIKRASFLKKLLTNQALYFSGGGTRFSGSGIFVVFC